MITRGDQRQAPSTYTPVFLELLICFRWHQAFGTQPPARRFRDHHVPTYVRRKVSISVLMISQVFLCNISLNLQGWHRNTISTVLNAEFNKALQENPACVSVTQDKGEGGECVLAGIKLEKQGDQAGPRTRAGKELCRRVPDQQFSDCQ
jgi:hypothetical protein